ncbi:unnamed protein product [Parnassius mnemosyne]|uniref:FHA domain-containing protein n=1 Tax=Parnassius mnemosyne TaxID=213953 RepID=A0AAV1LM50_9NEOP
MWYLSSQSDSRIIYIVPHKEIIIGRSGDAQYCNFAVPDDPSISRKHATLNVLDDTLIIQDLGSKYGTYLNNSSEKLECNVKQKVNVNDIIKFGKMDCVWKVHFINYTTCTSTLKGENLQNLKMILGKLGGILKSEWDDSCAYLTMPAITLTIKVVLALVQGSFIVTTEFWNKCSEAVTKCTPLPDPRNFIPQIVETTLNKENVSFLPDNCRKTLFTGKTVVFFSRRQLDMYKNVLTKSSASALLLSETKMTKSMLCNDNIIVIQYNLTSTSQETQTQKNLINDIVCYLKSKGKRVVADAEIGLAILYCSLNKYCNPDFNFSSEVIKQPSDQSVKTTNILAHESEEPVPSICKLENVVINESLNSKTDLSHVSTINNGSTLPKRKWDAENNDDSFINPNKKLATVNKITSIECSTKRTCEDIDEDNSNPTKKLAIENSNEDKDNFNFMPMSSSPAVANDLCRKLNLSKPTKRKQDFEGNEDDNLFNFIEENPKPTKISKGETFNIDKTNFCKEQNTPKDKGNSRNEDDKLDVSALRGIKLEELMQNNLKMEYSNNTVIDIKKEDITDIDGKLNDLDLGTTTVVLRNDLIVKKEPLQLTSNDSKVINFKKFKKVWPVKMQVSIIPKAFVNTLSVTN